jgi:tetratricopeptide (TPR) repeat protein
VAVFLQQFSIAPLYQYRFIKTTQREKYTMCKNYRWQSLCALFLLYFAVQAVAQPIATNLESANRPSKSSFSLLDLAKRSFQEQEWEEALVQVEAVLELNESNCEAYALRGAIQRELREPFLALNDFNKALEICPNDPLIQLDKGALLFEMLQWEAALEACDQALKLEPHLPKAFYLKGQCHAALKNDKAALEAYNTAVHLDSTFAMVYNNRGVIRSILGDLEGAVEDYTKGLDLDSSKTVLYQNRARAHLQLANYPIAISDFDKAIELSAKEAELYLQRGILRRHYGDYEGSMIDLHQAIRYAAHENAHHFLQLGLTYYHWRKPDSVLFYLDRALAINPNLAEAYYYKGLFFRLKNEEQKAIHFLTRCIEKDKTYIAAFSVRGDLWYRNGKFEASIPDFNEVIKAFPDDEYAFIGRGNAHRNIGKYKEAINDYTEALRQNNLNDVALHGRAMCKFQIGEFRSAIVDYSRAIELNPLKETYFNRAFARLAFNDKIGACEDFQKAADMGLSKAKSETILKACGK